MRRAIGIVRVSQTRGREGESFVSPVEQRERIAGACKRDGLELVTVYEELDVSGGTPLEKREGLSTAVRSVEAGEADVVMVAYFDRLVRSLAVQSEVVTRVEAAGGRVVALDVGQVSGATAALWLQGTMIGAVSEYLRRSTKERAGAAQADAVARGVAPFPLIPPGYERDERGVLTPNADAPAVRAAFLLRAEGKTIADIRAFLQAQGIERSYHGVQSMLTSRVYLGEIHFGKLVNLEAHEPLIDRDVWQAVQRVSVSRGRRAKSERLLARLGVLRCGTCGSRMVVGTQTQGGRNYAFYRCPPTGDCPRRVTIGAEIAEEFVVARVKKELAGIEESASAAEEAKRADADLERAQAALDAAIRSFTGLEIETAVRERLAELRAIRDEAEVRAAHLRSLHSASTMDVSRWDDLDLGEHRAVIAAVVDAVTVANQGRGVERLSILFK